MGRKSAALLEIAVVECGGDGEAAWIQDAALDAPIAVLRGLLPEEDEAFELKALRASYGESRILMVMQKPLHKYGWNLPRQWSTRKALGPYLDLMERDVEVDARAPAAPLGGGGFANPFGFRPPAEGDPVKQTVVLVTKREVADEEVFLDYKLRAEGPLESWYSPVTR